MSIYIPPVPRAPTYHVPGRQPVTVEVSATGNNDLVFDAQIADAVVLFTEWNQYRALDIEELKRRMKSPVFVDLRNVYQPEQMKKAGFSYYGVGRG